MSHIITTLLFTLLIFVASFTIFENELAHAAPTRFYFANTAVPSTNPTFDVWGESDGSTRRQLLSTKSTSETLSLGTRLGWTVGSTQLDRQYVSEPMIAGISFSSATVKLQLACREFNNGDNSIPRVAVKIVSQDGTKLRQRLLTIANYGTTTEYINNVSLRNVQFANGDVLTGTYTTTAGDRLVIEIGHSDASGSSPEAQCRYGAPSSVADHGENNSENTSLVPWIEFSNVITLQTSPSQATGLTATAASDTQINLSWNAPSSGGSAITGYKIEKSVSGGAFSVLVANTASTSTTYSDTGLAASTSYSYRISAINAIGTGAASSSTSTTTNAPPATAPSQATGLTATAASDTQINLSWNAPSSGGSAITGYKIEKSVSGGAFSVLVANTASTSTTYSDTGLVPNTRYDYQISAINDSGIGIASESASTVTNTSILSPDKPNSVQGVIADNQFSISWMAPTNDGGSPITDYIIEYSNDGGSVWNTYEDGIGTQTAAVLSKITIDTEYRFRISAVNAIGVGSQSEVLIVTPSELENTPKINTDTRNPPKIVGIGVFEIIKTEKPMNTTLSEETRFENYMPYSVYSYHTDEQNYSQLGYFGKVGQFFDTEKYSTRILPVSISPGKMIQIQVQLQDEYDSWKIQHLALYFDFKETSQIEIGKTSVEFNSPDTLSVLDPDGLFQDVKATKSVEDGRMWVIFDITFAKASDNTDLLIETWHESKRPAYAKIENIWEKFNHSNLISPQESIGYFARISIPQTHTSPVCQNTDSCFDPQVATILKGGIAQWSNDDITFIHVITSGSPQTGPDNRFNGLVRPGETYQHIFSAIGTYPYYCAVHPWSKGIVNVYEKTIPVQEKSKLASDNVSGQVTIPEKQLAPLKVIMLGSGKRADVQPGDTIISKTKNLQVEISGNIGEKHPDQDMQVTIIRPDGTRKDFSIHGNADGNYFLPTQLGEKWLSGTYHVSVLYKQNQIGNISFFVTDDAREQGFGAILASPSVRTMHVLEQFEKGTITKETLKDNLKNLGWSEKEIGEIFDKIGIVNEQPAESIKNNENAWYAYLSLLVIPFILIVAFHSMRSPQLNK